MNSSKLAVWGAILGLGISAGWGCGEALNGGNGGRNSVFTPYHIASQKDTPEAYRNFIAGYSTHPYADKAKRRLAELLNQKKDKAGLLQYAADYPNYRHLIEDTLSDLTMADRAIEHLMPDPSGQHKIALRPGESFYNHLYFKAYVGHVEFAERTYTYKIDLDRCSAPDYIKVEILEDLSFVMEEGLHAMINVFYKVTVLPDAPAGSNSHIMLTFGVYRDSSPEEHVRKESAGINHSIEVQPHKFDPEDVEVDYRGIKYFTEKEGEVIAKLNKLHKPNGEAFGTRYLHTLTHNTYQFEQMKYKFCQNTALHHLEQAAQTAAPPVAGKAAEYLNLLKKQESAK